MGFAKQVKAELARVFPENPCCQEAELAGFSLAWSPPEPGPEAVVAETRSSAVARKLLILCRNRFGWKARVEGVQGAVLRVYRVKLSPEDRRAWEQLRRWRPPRGRKGACCRGSCIRGMFLAAGYLVKPHKGYHLEWVLPTEEAAAVLQQCLRAEGIAAREMERKGNRVVYVKEADAIAEVLTVTGAHHALLQFEDIRVMKGMRNEVNRLVNAETANVNKAVAAALEQVEAIRRLAAHGGLRSLPSPLRAAAEARLAHPYASLKELAEQMDPPVSKSTLGYRMRRVMELARQAEEAAEGGS